MSKIIADKWFVYILRCKGNNLYTGITTNIPQRILEHQSQDKRAAKYLRGKLPIELAFSMPAGNRSTASKIEYYIKRLSKKHKELLIQQSNVPGQILDDVLNFQQLCNLYKENAMAPAKKSSRKEVAVTKKTTSKPKVVNKSKAI